MTEMAMTADRLIVVGRGRLIADSTVEEFTARGEQWVVVRSARGTELAAVLRNASAAVERADGESDEGDHQVRGLTAKQIGDLAFAAGIAIHGLTEQRASLEEVFFGMTGDSWAYLHRREQRGDGGIRALLFDPTARSLNGVVLAQLAIGVLGVLVMSSEYATGMIRTSLAAVPNRRILLLAKTIVLATVSLIVAMISVFLAFTLGRAVLSSDGLGTTIGAPSVLRAVFGAGLYLTLIGLFGLALGTIVRRTPGAIAALFGIVLILPLLAQALRPRRACWCSWPGSSGRMPLDWCCSAAATPEQAR